MIQFDSHDLIHISHHLTLDTYFFESALTPKNTATIEMFILEGLLVNQQKLSYCRVLLRKWKRFQHTESRFTKLLRGDDLGNKIDEGVLGKGVSVGGSIENMASCEVNDCSSSRVMLERSLHCSRGFVI